LTCHCEESEACHADALIEEWHRQHGKPCEQEPEADYVSVSSPGSDSESVSTGSDRELAMAADFSREALAEEFDPLDEGEAPHQPLPEAGLWVHVKWGTWHQGSTNPSKLLCSRKLDLRSVRRYARMGAWPRSTVTWCATCLKRAQPDGAEAASIDVGSSTASEEDTD